MTETQLLALVIGACHVATVLLLIWVILKERRK